MACHQEPMATRSTALLQQIEGSVLGGYRSCLFSGHDTPPAQLTLLLPSVYHFHSLFATLVFLNVSCTSVSIFAGTAYVFKRLRPSFLRKTPTCLALRLMPVSCSIMAAA